MCDMNHEIQTINLDCPDAIAVLMPGVDDREATMFYDLDQLVKTFIDVLGPLREAAGDDPIQQAFVSGAAQILLEIIDMNESLVQSSAAKNFLAGVTDLSDLFPNL